MFEQLERSEKRYQELEHLLVRDEVLSNRELYNKYAKELSDLKESVSLFRKYKKVIADIEDLELMLKEKHERQFLELAKKELQELANRKQTLEDNIKDALAVEDKDAGKDVIVEIRQGTGGNEAALFAADLYRIYTKYAARRGWSTEIMSSHPTGLGGFKEIIFSIEGKDTYKRLKFESGVHRVQRVPATEAQGRIHTSTATVAALIEPEDVELAIDPKDLRIDTYRSSGPGGQHMQKSDSAVRITYLPSGIVVACQDERSQLKNKNKAMRILRARLLDIKKQEEMKKISRQRKSQIGSGDRSEKIRTYNFPDRRVTDHRINLTLYKLEAILEGDLDEISDALIEASERQSNESR
ncbi:MAG: peptide chain release factor 1 [Candidatus Omnitrophica bacterium]|nr:peptide chain release factor 1 [Candidatus Omnitrophota bacterium]MBU4473408.1 peptide chain release factor 1 [Candidatus Omnitrophota bacterium]MCG2706961.1 peptide chain release factor 1 [Candidatus Omnitrophota bacterium]